MKKIWDKMAGSPMSGDAADTKVETHSSASLVLELSSDLESNVKSNENGTKSGGGIHGNGDHGSSEDVLAEMEEGEEALTRNGGTKDLEQSRSGELEMHDSSDGVIVSGGNCKPGDGVMFVAENGKDPGQISVGNPVSGSEMCCNGNVVGEGETMDEVESQGKEKDDEEKEDEDDSDNEDEFHVGQFVWGKIRNNPWWPGQIYESSEASDLAKKVQNKQKLLVAYFGDSSFSWCSRSQLKPFAENFEKMSKQNTSSKLSKAVQEALDEIGRIVESKMSCSCISERNLVALARPLAVNAGIREGAIVPDYESSILQLEPFGVVSLLKNVAKIASSTNLLELTILESWLRVFYRVKGGHNLATFYEPQLIEGLEDSRNGLVAVEGPVLDADKDISDEDQSSLPAEYEFSELDRPWLRGCEGVAADKLYKRRKRRSVAKIMKEGKVVEPTNEIGSSKKGSQSKKRRTRLIEEGHSEGEDYVNERMKPKTIKSLEEVLSAEQGGNAGKDKDQGFPAEKDDRDTLVLTYGKKKQKASASLGRCTDKALNAKNGDAEGQMVSGKKRKAHSTDKVEKTTKGETANVGGGREKRGNRSLHKKSKGKSGEKAPDPEITELASPLDKRAKKKKTENLESPEITEKQVGEIGSKKEVINITDNENPEETENVQASSEKIVIEDNNEEETQNTQVLSERKRKKSIYLSPPYVNLNSRSVYSKKVRAGEQMAGVIGLPNPAPRPSKEEEKKIIESVKITASMEDVVSKVRSAAINPLTEWDEHMVQNFVSGYKNIEYLNGSCYNKFHNASNGEMQESLETGFELVKENEDKTNAETSKPASLVIIFPSEFCPPSKTGIVTIFSRYGAVNEMETELSYDTYCARVVFFSESDTQKAFELCVENSPFGSAAVKYRLRYSAGSSKAQEMVKKPNMLWSSPEFQGSCDLFIKQRLEHMTTMVNDFGGNMSSEQLSELENEVKGLLNSISTIKKSGSVQGCDS